MIKNYNELQNEIKMLEGNIARICLTKNFDELDVMYKWAKLRLEEIKIYNYDRINKIPQK